MAEILIQMTLPLLEGLGVVMYAVGMISTFVMIFFVPFRIVWVFFSHFLNKSDHDNKKYYISLIFLVLSILPIVEFFVKAESGSTSGLFLIVLTPIPFFFYIIIEIIRFNSFINDKSDLQQPNGVTSEIPDETLNRVDLLKKYGITHQKGKYYWNNKPYDSYKEPLQVAQNNSKYAALSKE